MTTPEQAHQQLRHAEQLHRQVASFNPVWITYTGLCAAGSLFTMGKVWAPESPLPLSLALTWIMLSVCLIGIFSAKRTRRGFGRRWLVFMALWAAAWLTSTVAPLTTDIAMMLTVAYMCLSFAGPAWEVWRNR